jgi:hypothetical protein
MPKFKLDEDYLLNSRSLVSDQTISSIIYENNERFLVWKDPEDGIQISCENRPRDALLLGIKWIEVTEKAE